MDNNSLDKALAVTLKSSRDKTPEELRKTAQVLRETADLLRISKKANRAGRSLVPKPSIATETGQEGMREKVREAKVLLSTDLTKK